MTVFSEPVKTKNVTLVVSNQIKFVQHGTTSLSHLLLACQVTFLQLRSYGHKLFQRSHHILKYNKVIKSCNINSYTPRTVTVQYSVSYQFNGVLPVVYLAEPTACYLSRFVYPISPKFPEQQQQQQKK